MDFTCTLQPVQRSKSERHTVTNACLLWLAAVATTSRPDQATRHERNRHSLIGASIPRPFETQLSQTLRFSMAYALHFALSQKAGKPPPPPCRAAEHFPPPSLAANACSPNCSAFSQLHRLLLLPCANDNSIVYTEPRRSDLSAESRKLKSLLSNVQRARAAAS